MHPLRITLRINRRSNANVEAKLALRSYVDQLPFNQQRAFVLMATQLINTRDNYHLAPLGASPQQSMAELQHCISA